MEELTLEHLINQLSNDIGQSKCVLITGQTLTYNPNASNSSREKLFQDFMKKIKDYLPKKTDEQLETIEGEEFTRKDKISSKTKVVELLNHTQTATDLALNDRVQKFIWEDEVTYKPNDIEEYLMKLKFNFSLTGSFGYNLEKASEKCGHQTLFLRSYGLNDADKINSSIINRTPGIIHYMGKAAELDVNNFLIGKDNLSTIIYKYAGTFSALKNIMSYNSLLMFDFDPEDQGFIIINELFKKATKHISSSKGKPTIYYLMRNEIHEKFKINNTNSYVIESLNQKFYTFENNEELLSIVYKLSNIQNLTW